MLRLDRVSFQFPQGKGRSPKPPILHDVSLAIAPGECLVILGPVGAGKTSFLRLLNRLNEPSRGEIFYGDRRLSEIPITTLRRQIVGVWQEPKLLGMTVEQAIAYPLTLQNLGKTAIQERVVTILEQFEIPNAWLDRTEVQLSLGQRQWVAIARALILEPSVLVLDDITVGLDIEMLQRLDGILQAGRSRRTIVMATQDWLWAQRGDSPLERLCQRAVFLQEGRMIWERAIADVDWETVSQQIKQTRVDEDWE